MSLPFGVRVATRVLIAAVGIASACWALLVAPAFWWEVGIVRTAERIIEGEVYKPEALDGVVAQLQEHVATLRPSVLSKAAVIHLRRAQDAVASGQIGLINARLDALHDATDSALMNAPSDPFLWFARFWSNLARNGFAAERLADLRMSYVLGPNEGWIAMLRNRLALTLFSALPPDLAEAAKAEFAGLVRSRLYEIAADSLAGPGWELRQALLAGLRDVGERERRAFARVLGSRDLKEEVSVPGIDPSPRPPWQR
jgi:hypothetical protein